MSETATPTPADVALKAGSVPYSDSDPAQDGTDWKAEARKWEARAKENRAEAEKLATEKQDIETKLEEAATRAETAEQWKAAREAADAHAETRAAIASEFGISPDALRGETEDDLRAHAEVLKPLIQQPVAPVVPNAGDSPNKPAPTDLEQFASELFGGGD